MKPFLWNLESHNRISLKKEIEHRKVIHSTDEPFHPQIIKTPISYRISLYTGNTKVWKLDLDSP